MSLFNTKDEMFRALDIWNSKTFGAAFSEIVITEKNSEVITLLKTVIEQQNLTNKRMNGYCSEGLKVAEFEKMGICYVDLFNKLEKSDEFWTPLSILYEMCKHTLVNKNFYIEKAIEYNMSFDEVTWLMCGRAIRALPSYIREYQLRNALKSAFPMATFYQDEEMDKRFHCDIKMESNGQTYYFWSFISSQRSIYQFVDKFKNHRYGKILDGMHVLCPFDRYEESDASYKGWCFYSSRYVDEVKNAIFKKAHLSYDYILNTSIINVKNFKRPIVVDKNVFDLAQVV